MEKEVYPQQLDENFPALKGHPKARDHAAQAAKISAAMPEKAPTTTKKFEIYRWNPEQPHRKPFLQFFFVGLSTCGPMVLNYFKK